MHQRATTTRAIDPATRRPRFDTLYDGNVAVVFGYVFARCRDRELAEDVTHDVFMKVVRTVDDPTEVTVGWLTTVARNRLVDLLRREARYRDKLRLIEGGLAEETSLPDIAGRIRVAEAFARLSVEHRLVLTLHYLDDRTVPELADELGRSTKSVEGLVTRARRALRRELESDHV